MKILAIETSCDETALALIDVKKNKSKDIFTILGNDLASQISLHTKYGGVFPMMAKREHQKNILPVLIKVLKQAKAYKLDKKQKENGKLNNKIDKILIKEPELNKIWNEIMLSIKKPDVDAIAVTVGPGLEPALWVGINFAQALGAYWNLPVIPVNHMEGHIFSIFPQKSKKFSIENNKKIFPMLSLLVSGGHTEIVLAKDWMKYKVIGQTRDDAAGEAFDKVARMLGLPYPGGPQISKIANLERKKNNDGITLPRPMINSKDFDFSFSGLKTAVLYYIRDHGPLTADLKSKIAKEFEDAVIEVLVSKTLRAIKTHNVKTLIVGGGVSANTYLQKILNEKLRKFAPNVTLHFPSKKLSTDNALMIAIAGYYQYGKKKTPSSLKAIGNLSL